MSNTNSELEVLIQNGIEKEAALAALQVYGSAEKVLLAHVCGEYVEDGKINGESIPKRLDGDQFEAFVKATRDLSWKGVDLRRDEQESGEFSSSIASLGANFLRQACAEQSDAPDLNGFEGVSTRESEDAVIKQIMELGFSAEQARRALQSTGFNLEQAISRLLDNQ